MKRINFVFDERSQRSSTKFHNSVNDSFLGSESNYETKLLRQNPPLSDFDEIIMLLHTAAEIEHALLTQYLYSGYTLSATEYKEASRTLIQIAREEMGHLMSIQNILTLFGAPLNFEREDYPFNQFYPFPFKLEPCSVHSLAKYVLTEMPKLEYIPSDLKFDYDQIRLDANMSDESPINRVGALFSLLIELISDLPEEYFIIENMNRQAKSKEWSSSTFNLVLRVVKNKEEVISLLKDIAEQGEGSEISIEDSDDSHFLKLYDLYNLAKNIPQNKLPINYPVNPKIKTQNHKEDGAIQNVLAIEWCKLFDNRYRILLSFFNHYFDYTSTSQPSKKRKIRLKNWSFEEMRTCLKDLAMEILLIPFHDPPQVINDKTCFVAPTFELPYTLNLPSIENDKWRYHLQLINASNTIIDQIMELEPNNRLLEKIKDIDRDRKTFILNQISDNNSIV